MLDELEVLLDPFVEPDPVKEFDNLGSMDFGTALEDVGEVVNVSGEIETSEEVERLELLFPIPGPEAEVTEALTSVVLTGGVGEFVAVAKGVCGTTAAISTSF